MALWLSSAKKNWFTVNTKIEKQQSLQNWINTAFDVHRTLWTSYTVPDWSLQVNHTDNSYPIIYKEDFYCSVLPSYFKQNENNFWMTNNMARSTHGTYQINAAPERNEIHRITWVIGRNGPNEHYFKGHISTTHHTSGYLKYAGITVFYYGSSINIYDYVNRGFDNNNYYDVSTINPSVKIDYLIF
jgi:hypothetical protein